MDEREQFTNLISCLSSTLTSALLLLQLQAVSALKIAQQQSHSFNRSISFETLSPRFCNYSIELDTCLALPYNVMFSNIVEKTIKTIFFSQPSLSAQHTTKRIQKKTFSKKWKTFHKTYIKLQFYFSLRLMFKYFVIHVFFTPGWDFTSCHFDMSEIAPAWNFTSLRTCKQQGAYVETEMNSLHCGLPKWHHTCNHPLSGYTFNTEWNFKSAGFHACQKDRYKISCRH